MKELTPGNMWIANINDLIKKKRIKQVTSLFIKEPSSNKFHSEGLFSEEIFGQLASPSRLISFGYIDLKTNILHPHIYKSLIEVNRLYEEIMSGKTEVIFDNEINDFVKLSNVKQILPHHIVGTGYAFFLEHLDKIKLKENNSYKRNFSIKLINKYSDIKIIDKWIVTPAGIRDYNVENDQQQMEEMNETYMSILISTYSLPNMKTEDPLWNNIRYNLQRKVYSSYEYFFQILEGKGGFIQKKYTAKSVAMGTRNVLTGTKICSISSKKDRHKSNETKVPLFQSAKMYNPLVNYYMKTAFFSNVFDESSNTIFAIEPKTYNLVKIEISDDAKKKYTTREGINEKIEEFRNPDLRNLPLHIKADKNYYLFLIYEDNNEIHLFRNKENFRVFYNQYKNYEEERMLDVKKIRPLANVDILYICTVFASNDKFTQTTRYPVLGSRNTYLSKTVTISTEPDRKVMLINTLENNELMNTSFDHYPVIGAEYVDGVRIHPVWLKNLGGDHDGDTCSNIGTWTSESTKEIDNYMNSKKYLLTPSGKLKLTVSASNPIMDITLKNMCYRTNVY